MNVRVVLKQTVLHGSSQPEVLQKFAVVYIERKEYRVYAPPEAKGDALDWLPHCMVHESEGNSEIQTYGASAHFVLKFLQQELEKQKHDSKREQGRHPDGFHCDAQICVGGHVQHCSGMPFDSKAHCTKCGAPCLDECPHCKEPIRGVQLYRPAEEYSRPQYCHRCGKPYPWMEDRLTTVKDLLRHADKLSPQDRDELWEDLQYVMADPKGDLAPAKKKLIDIRLSGTAIKDTIENIIAKTIAEISRP